MRAARWRCYWRWPLGHRWEHVLVDQRHAYKRCAGCAKTKGTFRPDSPPKGFDNYDSFVGGGD